MPIVPGIMPIAQLHEARALLRCLRRGDPALDPAASSKATATTSASIRAFGLDVVTDLCADLLARGAPGLHFYTLNQAALTTTIWQRLGL